MFNAFKKSNDAIALAILRNQHDAAISAASLAGSRSERVSGNDPADVAVDFVSAYLAARTRLAASTFDSAVLKVGS